MGYSPALAGAYEPSGPSKSMSKHVAAFEKDRRRMLALLREMDRRVAEVLDSSIGDIGPLVQDLNDTDLAAKLGLTDPAIFIDERLDDPRYKVLRTLICNDPHGTRADCIQLSGVLKLSGTDPLASHTKTEDRRRLRRVLARWIRVVEELEEPEVYPAVPDDVVSGVDQEHWADSLWRTLYRFILIVEQGVPRWWTPDAHGFLRGLIGKVNKLTKEAGKFAPFRRPTEPLLRVYDPDDDHVLNLRYDAEGGITEPDAEELEALVRCLRSWQVAREEQLKQSSEEGPQSATAPGRDGDEKSAHAERRDKENPKGALSATALAEQYGLGTGAVRKALERFRGKNDKGWFEVADRRSREPWYLYDASVVAPILAKMLKRSASGETSG